MPNLNGFIRGADNRRDYTSFTEMERKLAADVGLIWGRVSQDLIAFNADTRTLEQQIVIPPAKRIYSRSKLADWREQRVPRALPGTAFAVKISGQRRIITANHCFENLREGPNRDLIRLVFNHHTGASAVSYLTARLVENNPEQDWAIFEPFDDNSGFPQTAKPPYQMELAKEIPKSNRSVFTLGFPHGLPVKLAYGEIFQRRDTELLTDLDVFSGNSGGPLIAMVGGKPLVVGIMRRAPESSWKFSKEENDGYCIHEPTSCESQNPVMACWPRAGRIDLLPR